MQISLMDSDEPPDNSIPNPVDAGPAVGDDEVRHPTACRRSCPGATASPGNAAQYSCDRACCIGAQIVHASGFKEELPDEGDEEAPPEDHVVQLRCVLEIMNTGAPSVQTDNR